MSETQWLAENNHFVEYISVECRSIARPEGNMSLTCATNVSEEFDSIIRGIRNTTVRFVQKVISDAYVNFTRSVDTTARCLLNMP
jgi:hypothetical protein